jgi:hypothetical protein
MSRVIVDAGCTLRRSIVCVEATSADGAGLAAGSLFVRLTLAWKRLGIRPRARRKTMRVGQRAFSARLRHAFSTGLGTVETPDGRHEISGTRSTDGKLVTAGFVHLARTTFLLFDRSITRPFSLVGHDIPLWLG